jgi:hypothetical protein
MFFGLVLSSFLWMALAGVFLFDSARLILVGFLGFLFTLLVLVWATGDGRESEGAGLERVDDRRAA